MREIDREARHGPEMTIVKRAKFVKQLSKAKPGLSDDRSGLAVRMRDRERAGDVSDFRECPLNSVTPHSDWGQKLCDSLNWA